MVLFQYNNKHHFETSQKFVKAKRVSRFSVKQILED